MGRMCCVPGCKSNYKGSAQVSVFRFPKDPALRQKWVRCIHRENFEPNDNSVVCINHFDTKCVIREDVISIDGSDPVRVPRKIPKLTTDAYPSIFPNQPAYLTTKLSQPRKDPENRKQEVRLRDENNFKEWGKNDVIDNFEFFTTEVRKRNLTPFLVSENEGYVLFYKLQEDDVPSIPVSFKVTSALDVQVYHRNITVPTHQFRWILESEGQEGLKCNRWSKFDSLVSHLGNFSDSNVTVSDRLIMLIDFVKDALKVDSDPNKVKVNKIKFALEQLELCETNQIRYSAELLVWAATISFSFPGAYHFLRFTNVMTLPHPVYLRKFLTKIGPNCPGIGPSQKAFLQEKVKLLQEHEKTVTVMLDEIYVKSKFSYKAGRIYGAAENCSQVDPASTMQVFMYSSLSSDVKDVIGLFPVRNMNADDLLNLTNEVIKVMHEVGLDVVCLICDNHRTNRKMFELLCGGSLKPCIPNPYDSSKSIFLLFDNVHLLKCVRNNWLNRANETFNIPNVQEIFDAIAGMSSITDGAVNCEYTTVTAKFSDLKDLFHSEKCMLLKLAPNLCRKALYPSSIERQNVTLAVNIFNLNNIAALEMLKSQGVEISIGTIQFLKLITKWWNICNVQHPMKGKYTRIDDAHPISGPDDPKISFLESFKLFLDIWQMSVTDGKLTQETYIALTHMLAALVGLCRYIFSTYDLSYILTAKLQNDGLEGRFSAYRRLSGCSYNVSVEQILESERKLKVLGVLKLKSAKLGEFSLKDFSLAINKVAKVENNIENLETLETALGDLDSVVITPETRNVLVCIASYTTLKVTERLGGSKCSECLQALQSGEEMSELCDSDLFSYFTLVNRGGLKLPSPILIFLCTQMFRLFQVLISDVYEQDFLKLDNHHYGMFTLGMQLSECIISNWDDVCKCGTPLKYLLKKCIKVLSNIFINNYISILEENSASKDIARKIASQKLKRKVDDPNELKLQIRKQMKLSSK